MIAHVPLPRPAHAVPTTGLAVLVTAVVVAVAFLSADPLRALMANGTVDLPLGRFFAFSVGAGAGWATVDVESDACLDPLGCPAPAWTDTRGSAFAWQYTPALSWQHRFRR